MKHKLINLNRLSSLMRDKPKAQRIYTFFNGANSLTANQISEIEAIIENELNMIKLFIKSQKTRLNEQH